MFKYLEQSGKYKLKVFYTWSQSSESVYDPGFGIERKWDLNLLEGYDYEFVENNSKDPGSHHFSGVINPALIQKITVFNPDAIIIYGWKFHSHLKTLRHFHGKTPIYFRGDSTVLDEPKGFSIKKLIRFTLLKWIYSHVDFALSPGTASDEYFKMAGLKPKQIIRLPHAVDNQRFFGEHEKKEEEAKKWRTDLGIPLSHTVFLFAGKLEPKKNPQHLINAFIELSQKRNDIHLIIVGNGILEAELKELSSTSTTHSTLSTSSTISTPPTPSTSSTIPTITFLPFQNQSAMPIVYQLGDVFVLPSKGPGETWGLAVNEAMACGKAVIVSDKCGSAKDLIENGINGFIFQSENQTDLMSAMFLSLSANLKEMGEASRKKINYFAYDCFEKIVL